MNIVLVRRESMEVRCIVVVVGCSGGSCYMIVTSGLKIRYLLWGRIGVAYNFFLRLYFMNVNL